MDTPELKQIWKNKYQVVPTQLEKIKQIKTAATAFNANIDAVIKISVEKFAELVAKEGLSLADLENVTETKINSPADVLKGIFKCFREGIAEEWITEEKSVYDWMYEKIGYDHLQIGGQGGIVANALATVGIQNVYVHTNSLPKLQADQFVKKDNLFSFDDSGEPAPAYTINRQAETPLIHWIIEFNKNDVFTIEGHNFRCPKSNRFIATYDPLYLKLVTDEHFIRYVRNHPMQYVILSGFHALTANNNGVTLIDKILPEIKIWKQKSPEGIFHLEIASTQDKIIRKAIVEKVAPLMDSLGINERETIDVLEIIGEESLAEQCRRQTTSENLFAGLVKIKEKTGVARIQLHMFGLYITLQDKSFRITPEADLRGMMTAATIAAAKAGTGNIDNLLWAQGREVSDVGLIEADSLAWATGQNDLAQTGIGRFRNWDLIVAPTILIEKPLTLVGMGDTISSLSLVGAL